MAAPRFFGGNDSRRMAGESGWRAPPPAPWMTRARSMMARVGAAPQAKLAAVKMVTQDMRKRLRPQRGENQLLGGGARAVSSTSMKVASMTEAAISQGLMPWAASAD